MDVVWDGRSDESRDEAGFGIGQQDGVILGANVGHPIVTNGEFDAACSQIPLGNFNIIIIIIIIAPARCY